MNEALTPRCPDCQCAIGAVHEYGCDVERCPRCGGQSLSCSCVYEVNGMAVATMAEEHPAVYTNGPTDEMFTKWDAEWGARRIPWSGLWPGHAECIELGWYARMIPGKLGWHVCDKDAPGAQPNLNRFCTECAWDATLQKFRPR